MSLDIKKVIKQKGLEVKDVANRMGISSVGLSQHINGNPSVAVLERIAEAIGCEVRDFFPSSVSDNGHSEDKHIFTCQCGRKYRITQIEE